MGPESTATELICGWQRQNPISHLQMQRFHDELLRYIEGPNATLFVRGRPIDRRMTFNTENGLVIAPTDNSPAWWAHKMVSSPNSVIDFEQVPTHMFDTGRNGFNAINRKGFYVAHIVAAKIGNPDFMRWSRDQAIARFICNIHPINHFYVPMDNRQLGESPGVIRAAASLAEEMYGPTWNEFLELAGDSGRQYLANLDSKSNQILMPKVKTTSFPVPVNADLGGVFQYSSTRLHFKAKFIEPLEWHQVFRVITPFGTFEFTKRQFYDAFPKIVASESYRVAGNYHGANLHNKASAFLVRD